jgi:hypothetical protein
MSITETDAFIGKFLRELREDNAAIFVGAGLSRAAGYVDWAGLLGPMANELGLDATKEQDLVGLAQYYLNAEANNRHALNQSLIDNFADVKTPTTNHEILARLPIRTYWTTNYDRLIEKALENAGKKVDAKYTVPQLAHTVRGRDVVLFKMHGDIEHPNAAVLTRDDYEKYHLATERGAFVTALSGDLVEKTFLFVGFSFTDPNLNYILSRIRVSFTSNQRQHYCLMKRRTKNAGEEDADFKQAEIRQKLMIADLMRFNIRTLLIDDHSQVTEILAAVERRFRQRTIMISGSAVEYGVWGRDQTETFLTDLSRELVKRDYRITTGFGLGVGAAVVTGAVQAIYSAPNRTIDEQLVMRPFPLGIEDTAERQIVFKRYREELMGQSGIAVFVLGNKIVAGKTIDADGVREEFQVAVKAGLCPIPVGATGFMAETLWKEVAADLKRFFPREVDRVKPLFDALGQPGAKPAEVLPALLSLIDLIAKD